MQLHYVWVMPQNIYQQIISVYDFSVDYDNIDADDILDLHKYLMKKHDIK